MMSVVGPVQSHYHEAVQTPVGKRWKGFAEKVGFELLSLE